MDKTTLQRGQMALIGALAGLCFYGLSEIVDSNFLSDRGLLVLITLAATFFTGLLAMAGPLSIARAAISSACLAVIATGLLTWSSFRFVTPDTIFSGPFPTLATLVISTVPLPFIIAAAGTGWRNYPALFSAAWTIVVRYAAAWIFVGLVWGVIYLSDTLFSIVGLTVIRDLIAIPAIPFVVTGLTLGLALAVVQEMKDYVSPYLILRLLRLLLPAILAVLVVFIVALPVQGFSGLFGGLSVAATLLAMTAASATLVTTAIDQSDAEATQSPLLSISTKALAIILPIPASLAAYSIWLRVDQYGWTPDRLFAASMAVLALGYGLLYAVAALRNQGWMERIRQGNIYMALAGVVAASLWLTPVLNAERISAKDLVARYAAGLTPATALDTSQLVDWGIAGTNAMETLTTLAKEPGQEALATALLAANETNIDPLDADPEKVLAELIAILPLQPVTATADQRRLLAGLQAYDLASWLAACRTPMVDGKPGCAMVIADFSGVYPGNEAIIALRDAGDSMRYEALAQIDGVVERRSVSSVKGYLPYDAAGATIIAEMQSAPPVISPAPINQMTLGGRDLIIFP
jgi:Domain of unknown function (DUF4153)